MFLLQFCGKDDDRTARDKKRIKHSPVGRREGRYGRRP
jgi:hypothetical protein